VRRTMIIALTAVAALLVAAAPASAGADPAGVVVHRPWVAGASNIPRGVWTINGVYTIDFSTTNFKTVTIYRGGVHDVCADLD